MDYIEKQKLVIDTTINLTKKAGARGLLKGVRNLTDYFALNAKDFPDTTNGMVGFIQWSKENNIPESEILTTLIHDLYEFKRNRLEKWYCPRSYGYAEFIKE